jgi:NitT/TauT family transport system substrate-binding protein
MFKFLKNKFFISVIVLVIAIFGLFAIFKFYSGYGQTESNQKTSKVKLGISNLASNVYIYVGIENGIFSNNGIELETTDLATSVLAINALSSNSIDMTGYLSLDTGLSALISNPDNFKILTAGYEKGGTDDELASSIITKPSSPISSLKDLEGKKVAVQPGAFATSILKNVLTKNGVDVSKVEFNQIGVADHIQALEAGSIDVAFTYEPYVTMSQSKGFKIVKSGIFSAYYQNAPFAAMFISSKFIQEKPEVAKKLQKALAESIEYVNQNREASLNILPKYIKIDSEIATKVRIVTFEDPNKINAENIQNYADFSASQGVLKGKIEVTNLIYKP